MTETISATFDHVREAEQVINDLVSIGCRREDIDLFVADEREELDPHIVSPARVHTGVSWLTVTVPASLVEKVMGIIHKHRPHRIEGSSFQWRRNVPGGSYPF